MAKRANRRGREYRVFLSHSSQDRWICEVMREKIEAKGLHVWLDAFDLPGGANVKTRIREGVQSSDECLILLSPPAARSIWVIHEASLAEAFDKWTTVLLLHVAQADVPETLRESRFLAVNDFPDYLEQLTARARKI